MSDIKAFPTQKKQGRQDSITQTVDGDKVYLDVNAISGASIVTEPWDQVEVTVRGADGCPEEVVYSSDGVVVCTVTIIYNAQRQLERVVKS